METDEQFNSVEYLHREVVAMKEILADIQLRNIAKDLDKDFETSYTRLVFIMCVTYATLYGYMTLISVPHPAFSAVVPTVGFNLSTWSLPCVKRWWSYFRELRSQMLRRTTTGASADCADNSFV